DGQVRYPSPAHCCTMAVLSRRSGRGSSLPFMTILVTGSAAHLGEALMRTLRAQGRAVRGLDIKPSAFTDIVGSITDRSTARDAMRGVFGVIHTATLHKPHVATHSRQDFIDSNV